MNGFTIAYITLLTIYIILGFIFTNLMFLYKKRMRQYKKASRLLIVNKNNELKAMQEYLLEKGLEPKSKLFSFDKTNIDEINDNRPFYIDALNKAHEEVTTLFATLDGEEDKVFFNNHNQAILENDNSYRRIVMLHNKTAKTYNNHAQSSFFIFFIMLFRFDYKKDI